MVIALVVVVLLAAVAAPPLQRMRTAAALQNGRAAVTSALSQARVASTTWGRTSVLRLEGATDRIWVVVDTGTARTGNDTLVLGRFALGAEMGIDLVSNRDALCFNGRGVGATGGPCPATGAEILLTRAGRTDTIRVNSAGRAW